MSSVDGESVGGNRLGDVNVQNKAKKSKQKVAYGETKAFIMLLCKTAPYVKVFCLQHLVGRCDAFRHKHRFNIFIWDSLQYHRVSRVSLRCAVFFFLVASEVIYQYLLLLVLFILSRQVWPRDVRTGKCWQLLSCIYRRFVSRKLSSCSFWPVFLLPPLIPCGYIALVLGIFSRLHPSCPGRFSY